MILLLSAPASAGIDAYLEIAGGISQITNGQRFFNRADLQPSMDLAADGSLGLKLSPHYAMLQYHLGFQHRLSTGNQNGERYYTIHASYAYLRMESGSGSLTLGYSPWVFSNASNVASVGISERRSATSAYLLQFGYKFALIPKVDFVFKGSTEFFTTEGAYSPRPVYGLTVGMRFGL